MTTDDDSSSRRMGEKGRGEGPVNEAGFGKKVQEEGFLRNRPRKDICQQPPNVGTCASSVTRYLTFL